MNISRCLFCRVIARDLPATVVFEDDDCIAIEDVHPMAPVHVLVIPRKHLPSLTDGEAGDQALLGHLLLIASNIARQKGIVESGFRTVINTNAGAGQTVFHLHVHVMGGRIMHWPPG
jgi:histidine triad (HIT) family protein